MLKHFIVIRVVVKNSTDTKKKLVLRGKEGVEHLREGERERWRERK